MRPLWRGPRVREAGRVSCECGHALEVHSDRAVFPPCEGTHPHFHEPMLRQLEDSDFTWISQPRVWPTPPCECKGYRRAG